MHLQLPNRLLTLDEPMIVGIVNITPDSFSDGGAYLSHKTAIAHIWQLVEEGAAMIDLGAESTRPGAVPVPAAIQLERLLPVIKEIAHQLPVPISVDTGNAEVITALADTQVAMINDVYALRQPDALAAFVKTNMAVCLMHMQNTPETMQHNPHYDNIINEVRQFLTERAHTVEHAGVAQNRITLDPGFGFGKSVAHNYQLLAQLEQMHAPPYPSYIGVSRKSMFNAAIGEREPHQRNHATLAAELIAAQKGAHLIRTHDVKQLKDALSVLSCTAIHGN